MHGPETHGPVERWLHDALAPSEYQVRRVVRQALREERTAGRRPPIGWRLPAALAALALLAMGFVALVTRVPPSGGEARPVALISNVSGPVELVIPEAPSARPVRLPSPGPAGVVQVFNRDGCMAAVLPGGGVRYVIIGGDT